MFKKALGTLMAGSFVVALAASAFAGENDCTVAKDPSTAAGKACAEGGIKAAKKLMKDQVKQAKKKGMKVDCDSCHKDETKWTLTDDAKKRYDEMLKTIGS